MRRKVLLATTPEVLIPTVLEAQQLAGVQQILELTTRLLNQEAALDPHTHPHVAAALAAEVAPLPAVVEVLLRAAVEAVAVEHEVAALQEVVEEDNKLN